VTAWSTDIAGDEDEEVATEDGAEVVEEVEEVVAIVPFARPWKVANCPSPGLMAKTIPFWQWPVCLQYTHTGLVSLTVNVAVVRNSVAFVATGTNPESNPPARGEHGSSKDDWVTVWFNCLNVKTMVSPTLAVTNSGVYATSMVSVSPTFPPTVTAISALRATGIATRDKRAAKAASFEEKNMIVDVREVDR